MELDALGKAVLSTLLILIAAWDLKTRRLPHWIAWPLLLVAIVVRAWMGSWILLPLLVGLAIVELLPLVWRGPAVAVLLGGAQWGAQVLGDPATQLVALWWGIAYGLWTLHVLGGGDVRVFMALVALFPSSGMVAALWGGLASVSVAWLVLLYRRDGLGLLLQAGQGISGGRYPSREDLAKHGKPTTPGLALGALAYLWLIT
jgi:Flp pilus assembly protein protease CpaA